MQTHLAHCRFGRILLHVACACYDHHYHWHWRGIRREIGARRAVSTIERNSR